MIKHIFSNVQQCFLNGNFSDVSDEVVSTQLNELLTDSKKLPEFVLHFKASEKNVIERIFVEDDVRKEHKLLKEKEAEEVNIYFLSKFKFLCLLGKIIKRSRTC